MALGRVTAGLVPRALASGLVRKQLSTLASNQARLIKDVASVLQHLSLFGFAGGVLYLSERYSEESKLASEIAHIRGLIAEQKPWEALSATYDLPSESKKPASEKSALQAEALEALASTVSSSISHGCPSLSSLESAMRAAAQDKRDAQQRSKRSSDSDSPEPLFQKGVSALWRGDFKGADTYLKASEERCTEPGCVEQARLWQTIAQRAGASAGAAPGL